MGSAVIEQLLKLAPASKLVAFARNQGKAKYLIEKGIEVRYGTFEDVDSLDIAMQGIEKVLLVSTIDHDRFQQHKNVVDAAKKAGVKYLAYTSALIKDVDLSPLKGHLESHFQTEAYIKQSGINYGIFRNSLYMDMIPIYVGTQVLEKGVYLPAGNGKVGYALRSEMGEAIANTLVQSVIENSVFDLTGGALYSFADVAEVLAELTGKEVSYTDANADAFPDVLRRAGVQERMILVLSAFTTDIRSRLYEVISNDMEILLGRKPAVLKEALRKLYKF